MESSIGFMPGACLSGSRHPNPGGPSRYDPPTTSRQEAVDRSFSARDLRACPELVIWEATQDYEPRWAHRRAGARMLRHALELSTAEAFNLIDQLAVMRVPQIVVTGGDPLRRPDLCAILRYAHRRGVRSGLMPRTAFSLSCEALRNLRESVLTRLALNLEAAAASADDRLRGVSGGHRQTIRVAQWCHEAGIPFQANTRVTRQNLADLDKLVDLLSSLNVAAWSVFLPAGRGPNVEVLNPEEQVRVLAEIEAAAKDVRFPVKTTVGGQPERQVSQPRARNPQVRMEMDELIAHAREEAKEGKDFMFISYTGEVYPGGFLSRSAGNVLWEPLAALYQGTSVSRSAPLPPH